MITLAAMMAGAVAQYDDMFSPDGRRCRTVRDSEDNNITRPSQTRISAPQTQLHDFTVKGITYKAKSRQDAIKMAVRDGVLLNKKKKKK